MKLKIYEIVGLSYAQKISLPHTSNEVQENHVNKNRLCQGNE